VKESTLGRDWVVEAQKLLLSLRDIVGADISVSEDGRTLQEINILAEGHRPPKQIVRDVRSALRAEYQVDVDYRKISVAQRRESEKDSGRGSDTGATVLTLPAVHVEEEPAANRLRFEGVGVEIDQSSCSVRVELALGNRETVGEASGNPAGYQVSRLVAEATLAAVTKFLEPGYSLVLTEIKTIVLGGEEIVLVAVKFFKERAEKTLVGSCSVDHSLQQSVVYATLDALNRILGRLRYREPVEYEIRPTSTF
jgi:hypothetical protein